jgi:hypothetical protein
MADPAPRPLAQRIRKTAIGLFLLALGFYLGFIALSVYRGRH